MAINFNKALSVHQHTIGIREERANIIASNIANSDTPNYKARDLDFASALKSTRANNHFKLNTTNENHIQGSFNRLRQDAGYIVPNQPDTGDGNTVDGQVQKNNFLENAMEHQASLDFLKGKFTGMLTAIKGQN